MKGDPKPGGGNREPLTDEQQRLVRENIGLVMVHLRRNIRNLTEPRRDREWEDLFQEGCLGLIRAAMAFRVESGIPFAAFALPRIHNAVSRALQSKFAIIHVPPKRPSKTHGDDDEVGTGDARRRVRVRSLCDDDEPHLVEARRHDPSERPRETVGQRLRGKYERAARAAAQRVAAGASRRGDRGVLARILLEERLLVPNEESRTALRQIARQTKSSYARVAQCDKQIAAAIRTTLDADPEFRELQQRARTSPDGTEQPIDGNLERALAAASAGEFLTRFHAASPDERAALFDSLVAATEVDLDDVLRDRVERMPGSKRERLLAQSPPSQTGSVTESAGR